MDRVARILVVDDEPGMTRVLASVLAEAGFQVGTACDGQTALEQLGSSAYDLVLLDYMMPSLDGSATLEALRCGSSVASVRVVMMSALPEAVVRDRCRYRMDGFLRKPFPLETLMQTVRRQISATKRHAPTRLERSR